MKTVRRLLYRDIAGAVGVGHPTMQHPLLGLNRKPLGRGPYLPVLSAGGIADGRGLAAALALAPDMAAARLRLQDRRRP